MFKFYFLGQTLRRVNLYILQSSHWKHALPSKSFASDCRQELRAYERVSAIGNNLFKNII